METGFYSSVVLFVAILGFPAAVALLVSAAVGRILEIRRDRRAGRRVDMLRRCSEAKTLEELHGIE